MLFAPSLIVLWLSAPAVLRSRVDCLLLNAQKSKVSANQGCKKHRSADLPLMKQGEPAKMCRAKGKIK